MVVTLTLPRRNANQGLPVRPATRACPPTTSLSPISIPSVVQFHFSSEAKHKLFFKAYITVCGSTDTSSPPSLFNNKPIYGSGAELACAGGAEVAGKEQEPNPCLSMPALNGCLTLGIWVTSQHQSLWSMSGNNST